MAAPAVERRIGAAWQAYRRALDAWDLSVAELWLTEVDALLDLILAQRTQRTEAD